MAIVLSFKETFGFTLPDIFFYQPADPLVQRPKIFVKFGIIRGWIFSGFFIPVGPFANWYFLAFDNWFAFKLYFVKKEEKCRLCMYIMDVGIYGRKGQNLSFTGQKYSDVGKRNICRVQIATTKVIQAEQFLHCGSSIICPSLCLAGWFSSSHMDLRAAFFSPIAHSLFGSFHAVGLVQGWITFLR